VSLFRDVTSAGRSLVVVSNDYRITNYADRVIPLSFADPDA
jgi:hypothetical protein